jgi:DNA-binding NarL/FixJ family response regulator
LSNLLDSGITSYLLKECDKAEIMDAINSTIKDQKFICGKIVSILTSAPELTVTNTLIKKIGCDGMHVTERETEIIKAIAEGLSNKLIADKLNLSTHTVNTHRKNIMQKLGVNNTAGVVMFAVKNNLLETNFSF